MKSVLLRRFMEKTLFVSDVATGRIKLTSGLSGTVSFLQVLGSLYNSFGIRAQSIDKAHMLFKMP